MKRAATTIVLAALALCTTNMWAADVTITFRGSKAKIVQRLKDSVTVMADGARVSIESTCLNHQLSVLLKGKSADGQLVLKTPGKACVTLDGLELTSREGAPLWLKNKNKVELTAARGTDNTLTIEACRDTALHKAAVIFVKDKLLLNGQGTLRLMALGDGCKGINAKDDLTIEDLTLDIETRGNNLGEVNSTPFGSFGGPPMGVPGDMFGPENMSEEEQAQLEQMQRRFEGMRQRFEQMRERGELPDFGGGFGGPLGGFDRNDSTRFEGNPRGGRRGGFGGFRDFATNDSTRFEGGPMGGGGFMKHNYVGTTKGIKALGKLIVNSGNVHVKTQSDGAEGIEGKQGIELNGGTVYVEAVDDAVNANDRISFNGAHVTAISTTNDAVDANFGGGFMPFFGFGMQKNTTAADADPMDKAAIVVTGGTVFAWSQRGTPEEGLDCDFAPLAITGGVVFSVGAGMGEMPSVPTSQTALQPTALLTRLNISKDQPVSICNEQGQTLHQVHVPFDFNGSASIVSCPQFASGATYQVKSGNESRRFTFTENFVIVR